MRIKLSLRQVRANQLIPINYQYALSSFIYRTIETSDNEYSKWLHEKGFMSGSKKFKMFTFSKLYLPDSEVTDLYEKKYLKINGDKAELIVSMLSNKTMEHFIIGMFEDKKVKVFDRNIESDFHINTVELIPEPVFGETMTFRTISPIVISKSTQYNGKISQTYLSPEDEDYSECFIKNLEGKLLALMENNIDINFLGDFRLHEDDPCIVSYETIGNIKSKLITIKEDSLEESKVKGFFLGFKLTGNPAVMKLGYEAGFGKLCSQGFGCVDVT